MALVTQFGATTLAVQDALQDSVIVQNGDITVANVLIISLDREEFLRDHKSQDRAVIDRFRNRLREEIEVFCSDNNWSFSQPLSLNILLRSLGNQCNVRAEHRDALYKLSIRDDSGERTVSVESPTVVLGRAHQEPPRGFVLVHDASRSFSREHALLTFRDLELVIRLLGQNPTYLNDSLLRKNSERGLAPGDMLRCGPHSIELISLFV
ncbi:MAG: FHA domain-containing protein [Chlorobi bacterium]|nr:FHA domain-containing protein [Chlorobiota bacterium]